MRVVCMVHAALLHCFVGKNAVAWPERSLPIFVPGQATIGQGPSSEGPYNTQKAYHRWKRPFNGPGAACLMAPGSKGTPGIPGGGV